MAITEPQVHSILGSIIVTIVAIAEPQVHRTFVTTICVAEEADPATTLAARAIGDAQALTAVSSMCALTEPQVLKHLDWICVATTEPQVHRILDTAVPAVEGDPATSLAAIAIADARALTALSSMIPQSQRIVRTASSRVTITLGVRKIRGKQHRPAKQLKLSGRLIPG